jgi:hypothetical protein
VSILSLRVRNLHHRDGEWYAVVSMDGQSRWVDRKFGSWRVTPPDDGTLHIYQQVMPSIAAELQRLVRQRERKQRRRNADKAEDQAGR